MQKKVNAMEKQVQIMQVDLLDKDGTIQKIRELVEQRDERISAMRIEIETM